MKRFLFSLLLGLVLVWNFSLLASAMSSTIPQPDFILTPPDELNPGTDTQEYILNTTIPRGINLIIGVLGVVAFLGILIASMTLLTAYGNEDKINRAKNNLRYSIIGLLVTLLSYAIVSIVVSVVLPQESESWIPKTYALDANNDLDILLPNQETFIQNQDESNRVSLPSGDLFREVIPAIITNLLYIIGFLLFIAFMYGGVLLLIGRGNEESVTKAKNIMIYSAVAIGFASLGYAIVYGVLTLNLEQDTTTDVDDVFIEIPEE